MQQVTLFGRHAGRRIRMDGYPEPNAGRSPTLGIGGQEGVHSGRDGPIHPWNYRLIQSYAKYNIPTNLTTDPVAHFTKESLIQLTTRYANLYKDFAFLWSCLKVAFGEHLSSDRMNEFPEKRSENHPDKIYCGLPNSAVRPKLQQKNYILCFILSLWNHDDSSRE